MAIGASPWSATKWHELYGYGQMISIHAPARGATPSARIVIPLLIFQSTLPRGERQVFIISMVTYIIFQSTLPRGERLLLAAQDGFNLKISIHAPARGATRLIKVI